MKKNTIIVISLAILFILYSIIQDISLGDKITNLEKRITTLSGTTSTSISLFEKHTKCASLTPEIQKKIDSFNKEYSALGQYSIGGIFYSPIKDACLWVRVMAVNSKDGLPAIRHALFEFGEDSGNSEPIIGCERISGEIKGTDTCEKWDTEVKRLKGEENRLNP